MILFVTLSIIFICLIRSWYKEHYRYWVKRGFPSDGPCFPMDSLTGVATKNHNAIKFDELYKRFKGQPAVGLFFMFKPTIAICDPALIQSILVRYFTHFHDHFLYYNEVDDPLSANIFTIEGQKWKERRVNLSPIFTIGKMKVMFDIIDQIGEKFVLALKKGFSLSNDIEIYEWLARFTTDVICSTAFGLDCNCIENSETEFRKYSTKLFKINTPLIAIKFVFANFFPVISRRLGLIINEKEVSNFFLNTFRETTEYREKNNIERNDFVQLLLQMKRKGMLNFNEIAAESLTIYFGGFQTTASLMNFILYELALNQEVQTKLRTEIDDMRRNNEKLSYDSLSEMKYLDMVVNEALRKYPPVNILTRKCTKEFNIPGTNLVIPKDTECIIPIFSIHRDQEYYPDPERYDPERFNSANVQNRKPYTFLPFGEGPRICLGRRFALMTTKIALVKLLTELEFDKTETTLIPMKYSVKSLVLSPNNEKLYLQVRSRS